MSAGRPAIADTPEAITPAWLSEVLEAEIDGIAQVTGIGTGQMCDSWRLRLNTLDPSVPTTVVAKLPAADPTSRATALALRSYETEVRFYQQLAPSLPMRTPRAYHADIDVETASFVLLLEDLAPATQGDQLAGCTVAEATVAVDELVKLHAPRWADPSLGELEWLAKDPEAGRQFLVMMLPVFWDGFLTRYADRLGDDVRRVGAAVFDGVESYTDRAELGPATIVHGDYRLDNLLFGDHLPVAVVDWQTCALGPAATDLAYFVGAGLLADDRRGAEDELVRRYHAGLVERGVADYPLEQLRLDYRRGTFAGLVMAVAASNLVEQTDRGDEMFLAMAHRHAQHALDLDAVALLT